jgi:hypothetical protein
MSHKNSSAPPHPTECAVGAPLVIPYSSLQERIIAIRYAELCENLRGAAWIFEKEPGGRREGARLACHYVAHFLYATGASSTLAIPLQHTMKAFEDLQNATMPKLFSKDQQPDERGRDSERLWNKTWAAVLLEYAMSKKRGLREAADDVARAVNKWPAFTAQQITWSTIRDWRKAFKSDPLGGGADFKRISADLANDAEAEKIVKGIRKDGPL